MKKIILFCLASVLLYSAYGQTFVNNGAVVAILPGAVMIVKIDSANFTAGSGSLENIAGSTGVFRNAGQLTIEGSFVNTSGVADGFGTNTGQYYVLGDWENDSIFTADQSTVILCGSNQVIKGVLDNTTPNPTYFYNLIDTLPGSVKTQEVDAYVTDTLTLYSSEHATGDHFLTVQNPAADAIYIPPSELNGAFVSSTGNGRLVRNAHQKAEYIFPTGINEGGPKIREVSITPSTAASHVYSVRYADYAYSPNTTTTDGYDTARKNLSIGEVNDVYYHLISSNGNTDAADYAIFFDPAVDWRWNSMARWQVVPQWQDFQNTVNVADPRGTGRIKIANIAVVPTTDTAFALVDSLVHKADFAFPTAFVADGQGIAPENTYFTIINQADLVTLQELSVFNRWGEMVFDSKRDGNMAWYGHFNGKLQPQGNYVYRAIVINNSTGKQYPLATGNVALLW
jgi:hypothetical protein